MRSAERSCPACLSRSPASVLVGTRLAERAARALPCTLDEPGPEVSALGFMSDPILEDCGAVYLPTLSKCALSGSPRVKQFVY
mmetsp:Transcript_10718/g.33309  ORF Transcript_10718/g.33309 Transcript_10718/m.33309 type:complete len:83 (-) Transcript_10718:251-499(-)